MVSSNDIQRIIVGRCIPSSYEHSLPASWKTKVGYMLPEALLETENINADMVHINGDDAFHAACNKFNDSKVGFCNALSQLTKNKYLARNSLKSMQDIPFTICQGIGPVIWPGDANDKLFAKPVYGTYSEGVLPCFHGDILPDVGQPYIVEKYIPDDYRKISVDGFVTGDHKEMILTCDNCYHPEDPYKFTYMGFPSVHHNLPILKQKYFDVVDDLTEKTGCNNMIIGLELFVSPTCDEVLTMEINPRAMANTFPIYEEVSGYNVWQLSEDIRNGFIPTRNESIKNAVLRYNYVYASNDESCQRIQHDKHLFTEIQCLYGHTYAVSEHLSHDELYKQIGENFPIAELMNGIE